ncbi:hypothetical protein ACHQM5_018212 [Ranunculus cassubicifolius]
MFFFLVSCFSFILLSNSFSLPWSLLSIWFCKELPSFLVMWMKKNSLSARLSTMSFKKRAISSKVENVEETNEMSILDLPELALENILGMLPPSSLCNMAGVCSEERERCRSDHLWERHMNEKWGRVIGKAVYKQWQWHIATKKDYEMNQSKRRGLVRILSSIWPISYVRSRFDIHRKPKNPLPMDSVKFWYLTFESGKFWFPAQVYNREHGHVGFMLSCYDAELSYDKRTDTFNARYPPHGRRTVVIEGVEWDRLRPAPVDTPPHNLHISDCLNDLRPGDHIEIQWRRNKEFPYGWWYGVVGYLESCDGNEMYCRCHSSDTVILEFNQYAVGSRWRQTIVNRKDHREEGNEADGFYGGIRKISKVEELAMWKRLWPKEVLE